MKTFNQYAEAFKESYNVIGLTTAAAASLALLATPLMPLPLLVGLVAEAVYLLFVPDSRWYQARLAQRYDGEIEKRRAQLKARVLPQLRPQMQARFTRLEEVRRSIAEQAKNNGKEQPEWFREVLRKLDFLLEKFLHFASKDAQFRGYLESVMMQECGNINVQSNPHSNQNQGANTQLSAAQLQSNRGLGGSLPTSGRPVKSARLQGHVPPAPVSSRANGNAPAIHNATVSGDAWTQAAIRRIQEQLDRELSELRRAAEHETDANTRAVLDKRVDVLQRRREFIGKIGRIQVNLNHQLGLVEDTFGLISDEIRAQPPEQVLSDINDVVSQTNTMTQLLEEFAPFEQSLNT